MAENKTLRAIASSTLPNLFFATTYALNKSLSKRITIGLEHQDNFFKPVIKFSGSTSYQVTLDTSSWELFLQNLDVMTCYFKDPLCFNQTYGSPSKIYLPAHDIEFTTSYGGKCIVLINRPIVSANNIITITQSQGEDEEEENASKKKKINHPPSIVMQAATFDGLKELKECISAKLKELNKCENFVNRMVGLAIEWVEKDLQKNKSDDDVKKMLSDYTAFKNFCTLNKDLILEHIRMNISMNETGESLFYIFSSEFYAFGLMILASELYKTMFHNNLENF